METLHNVTRNVGPEFWLQSDTGCEPEKDWKGPFVLGVTVSPFMNERWMVAPKNGKPSWRFTREPHPSVNDGVDVHSDGR